MKMCHTVNGKKFCFYIPDYPPVRWFPRLPPHIAETGLVGSGNRIDKGGPEPVPWISGDLIGPAVALDLQRLAEIDEIASTLVTPGAREALAGALKDVTGRMEGLQSFNLSFECDTPACATPAAGESG